MHHAGKKADQIVTVVEDDDSNEIGDSNGRYKATYDVTYKVEYNSEGKISNVIALSGTTELVNLATGKTSEYLEITHDDYKVYVTYLYHRKVNMQIDKVNEINGKKLALAFNVTKNKDTGVYSPVTITTSDTDEGTKAIVDEISGNDEWVKYTITELNTGLYEKLEPFDLDVHYENGRIREVKYGDATVFSIGTTFDLSTMTSKDEPKYTNNPDFPFELEKVYYTDDNNK